jgi:hypothetical protein
MPSCSVPASVLATPFQVGSYLNPKICSFVQVYAIQKKLYFRYLMEIRLKKHWGWVIPNKNLPEGKHFSAASNEEKGIIIFSPGCNLDTWCQFHQHFTSSFRQKITNPNCKHKEDVQKSFVQKCCS